MESSCSWSTSSVLRGHHVYKNVWTPSIGTARMTTTTTIMLGRGSLAFASSLPTLPGWIANCPPCPATLEHASCRSQTPEKRTCSPRFHFVYIYTPRYTTMPVSTEPSRAGAFEIVKMTPQLYISAAQLHGHVSSLENRGGPGADKRGGAL